MGDLGKDHGDSQQQKGPQPNASPSVLHDQNPPFIPARGPFLVYGFQVTEILEGLLV
jgi:hypothetical protein